MADEPVITNPALMLFARSIVMRLVAVAGGWLIAKGMLTQEQVGMIHNEAVLWLTGLVLTGISIAYGLAQSYISRRKLLKAMALPFVVSEKELEARIKIGGAPSITTPKDELPGPSTMPKPANEGDRGWPPIPNPLPPPPTPPPPPEKVTSQSGRNEVSGG